MTIIGKIQILELIGISNVGTLYFSVTIVKKGICFWNRAKTLAWKRKFYNVSISFVMSSINHVVGSILTNDNDLLLLVIIINGVIIIISRLLKSLQFSQAINTFENCFWTLKYFNYMIIHETSKVGLFVFDWNVLIRSLYCDTLWNCTKLAVSQFYLHPLSLPQWAQYCDNKANKVSCPLDKQYSSQVKKINLISYLLSLS